MAIIEIKTGVITIKFNKFFIYSSTCLLALSLSSQAAAAKTSDHQKPVVSGVNDKTIYIGQEFNPMSKVKAIDSNDGNITNRITITGKYNLKKPGKYKLLYTVSDKAKNKSVLKRVLTVKKDTIKPKISGTSNKNISVGTSFNPLKGIIVTDNIDKNLIKNLEISGKVITKSPGKYKLYYSVKDSSGNNLTKLRIINVKDISKPVIKGVTNETIEVGTTFDDLANISAIDNIDGDLIKQLKVTGVVNTTKPGRYTLVYSVADKSGNVTSINRTIRVVDKTPPALKGTYDVKIEYGSKFDPFSNVTALDNIDGDITDSIEIKGSIDTSKEGTQTLTYTVSDSSGNSSTQKRTILVNEAPLNFLNTNEDYVSPDNQLTVNMSSIIRNDEGGYYSYTIDYSITNFTKDAIDEASFKIFFDDGTSTPQFGFFNKLYPGDSTKRTYSFKVLKSQNVKCIEYGSDIFFNQKPKAYSLKWK